MTLPEDRGLAQAKANVEAAVREAGFNWTAEVQRKDGYTLTLRNGELKVTWKALDEAVLDDAWSAERSRLIQEAIWQLEKP